MLPSEAHRPKRRLLNPGGAIDVADTKRVPDATLAGVGGQPPDDCFEHVLAGWQEASYRPSWGLSQPGLVSRQCEARHKGFCLMGIVSGLPRRF